MSHQLGLASPYYHAGDDRNLNQKQIVTKIIKGMYNNVKQKHPMSYTTSDHKLADF